MKRHAIAIAALALAAGMARGEEKVFAYGPGGPVPA
jgi:hypothetical protein